MDWDNSKIIIAKTGSSKPTNDKVMDYYKYPQYLYILPILARSYQTQQDLVSLKEITEIWASLAKILKALQINFLNLAKISPILLRSLISWQNLAQNFLN